MLKFIRFIRSFLHVAPVNLSKSIKNFLRPLITVYTVTKSMDGRADDWNICDVVNYKYKVCALKIKKILKKRNAL